MRLRNVPGAGDVIGKSEFCVQDAGRFRGNWESVFDGDAPLHLEIGMGKGRFLMETAARHPEIHYIGIEMHSSVLVRAVEKAGLLADDRIRNFRFIRMDATYIEDVFAPGEVERVYLNFSDPWPKERHAGRRLTSAGFLKRYENILSGNGTVEFKTDNEALFDFSLEQIDSAGWRLLAATRDLHHDETMNEGNILTEYEEKFSALGQPVFKYIAAPPAAAL